MSAKDSCLISGQDNTENFPDCQENDIHIDNTTCSESKKFNFKEPISISSSSDKKLSIEKLSAGFPGSSICNSSDFNDLSLSPDSGFSISSRGNLTKEPNQKNVCLEYPSTSVISSSGNVDNIHSDLTNVEEWLKHKSDSLSSLEFDSDMKPSEIDVTDFLSLKSMPSSSNLLDINSKHVHDLGLGQYAGGRPVTPSGLSNFSDTESLLFSGVNDYLRSKFQTPAKKTEFANLQIDKGIFEEMLVMDRPAIKKSLQLKGKDSNLGLDEKGLFEELLLPGVQEWLLSVATLDKKDSSSAIDSISIPPSPNERSTSLASCKETYDDYDIIGRNMNSLRMLTTQEIENLPSRTLELDENHLKNEFSEEEEIKQMADLSNIVANDVDNKLFGILAMDVSNYTTDAHSSINNSNLSGCYSSSLNKQVISPDQFINKGEKETKCEEPNIVVLKSSQFIHNDTPNRTSEVSANTTIPLATIPSVSQDENLVEIDNTIATCLTTDAIKVSICADDLESNFQVLCKKQSMSSIANEDNFELVPHKIITVKSIIKKKSIDNSTSHTGIHLTEGMQDSCDKELQSISIQVDDDKIFSSSGGIAKVNISVNCKNHTTNISVLSSNKEQTIFKINTSDIVRAISSIKETFLEPLGLKRQQLIEIANATNKLLNAHSQVSSAKGSLNSSQNPPQNFEINQLIREVKTPTAKSKALVQVNKSLTYTSKHKSNRPTTVKEVKDAFNLNHSPNNCKPSNRKLEQKKKCFIRIPTSKSAKARSLGENVGISLLPGAPPTMVTIPSVLDILSGPTTSKLNLAEALAKCEDEEQKKQKSKGGETVQVSDEKTNCALLQLGFDPYSLNPEVDLDGVKKWRCPISSCSKYYPKLSYLKVHILTHKGIRPYKCSYENCDWSFYTSYKLKRHLETHLKRRDFVCKEPDCNRRFTTIYNLNTHVALHKRPKAWVCSLPTCKLSFHTRRKLEVHMRYHTDANPPYKCTAEGCSKAYFTPNALASHTRSHHKEEDIRCHWEGCGKKFDKPCRLKAHMKAHTGQRPFACTFEGCNWRFHCASKLSRHQKKHTNDRKYSCPICKKAFLRSEHLKGHILTHTGVRNFQCPVKHCDAKFTAKSSLYVHLKKHKNAGAKLPCPFESCDEIHNSKFNLNQHLLNNHSPLTDPNHLDYIAAVNEKEVIGNIPDSMLPSKSQFSISANDSLALQNSSVDTSCGVGMEINDRNFSISRLGTDESSLVPLLAMSSGVSLVENPQENNMPILVGDNLLPFGEVESSHNPYEFELPELPAKRDLNSKKGITFKNESSARTDVVGNLILSQRAKRRQQSSLTTRITVTPDLRKVSFCNDLNMSSSVGDALSAHFQPVLLQDDAMSTALYQDLLTDPTNDTQSTINLRDLE